MDSLRIILLLAGVVLIAGIYLWGRRQNVQRMKQMRIEARAGDPLMDVPDMAEGVRVVPGREAVEEELARLDELITEGAEAAPEKETLAPAASRQKPAEMNKLVVLYVLAPGGVPFRGDSLIKALESSGLRYGDMKIFHRMVPVGPREESVYSVVNMVEPGTLNPAEVSGLNTPGIAFFLQLSGHVDGVKAYDDMVETAKAVAAVLDGEICDETRSVLSRQSIGHQREKIIEYQLRRRVAQNH